MLYVTVDDRNTFARSIQREVWFHSNTREKRFRYPFAFLGREVSHQVDIGEALAKVKRR
jgi:hypothetical protein